jgi:hypothetical protein
MDVTPARQTFEPPPALGNRPDSRLTETPAPRRGLAAVLLAALDHVLTAFASPVRDGEPAEFIDESWPATGTFSYWSWRRGRYL